MIFGYEAAFGSAKKRGLLVAMGVVALPLSFHLRGPGAPVPDKPQGMTLPTDPRVTRLRHFLSKLDCPVSSMAQDFVRVADEDHLDWRLLPSIAIIESSGGKAYKNNNIFGWDGGEQYFSDIRSGLELVGYKLGRGALYGRYDSLGKLRIYNENKAYADSVMAVMKRIEAEPEEATVLRY